MSDFLFYLFSLFTLLCAAGTILNRNTVHAAFCFLLCLVGIAGLFALLEAYLLAVLLVLVYAGAVVALFLFIIMLIDPKTSQTFKLHRVSALASVLGVALLVLGVVSFVQHGQLPSPDPTLVPAVGASLKSYGELLFTTYLLPLQMVGFLLLIAMLGVIVLSKKFEEPEAAE